MNQVNRAENGWYGPYNSLGSRIDVDSRCLLCTHPALSTGRTGASDVMALFSLGGSDFQTIYLTFVPERWNLKFIGNFLLDAFARSTLMT